MIKVLRQLYFYSIGYTGCVWTKKSSRSEMFFRSKTKKQQLSRVRLNLSPRWDPSSTTSWRLSTAWLRTTPRSRPAPSSRSSTTSSARRRSRPSVRSWSWAAGRTWSPALSANTSPKRHQGRSTDFSISTTLQKRRMSLSYCLNSLRGHDGPSNE